MLDSKVTHTHTHTYLYTHNLKATPERSPSHLLVCWLCLFSSSSFGSCFSQSWFSSVQLLSRPGPQSVLSTLRQLRSSFLPAYSVLQVCLNLLTIPILIVTRVIFSLTARNNATVNDCHLAPGSLGWSKNRSSGEG